MHPPDRISQTSHCWNATNTIQASASSREPANTPRVFRTERGNTPQHTPRGGSRPATAGTPRSSHQRDRDDVEYRTPILDDAFQAPLSLVEHNAHSLIEAIIHVLRYHGGVQTRRDHGEIGEDEHFVKLSSHFTYAFRHSYLKHSDGSLSLNEIFNHQNSIRKIKKVNNEGNKKLTSVDKAELRRSSQSKVASVRFLMPIAHVLCNSNKSRFQLGYHTKDTFEPGTLVPEETWFNLAQFHQEELREQQAAHLESLDIKSVFIRTESGHSSSVNIVHPQYKSSDFPDRYLIHGTYESNLPSIRSNGLRPGGTRGGRTHVHFVLDNHMTKTLDSVRRESDCFLTILKHNAIDDLEPVFTAAGYVLTKRTVTRDRFCGVWSLRDVCWIMKPSAGEFQVMSDPEADVEIMMHIAYQQWYYDARQNNDQTGTHWTSAQYKDHLESLVRNPANTVQFISCFRRERKKTPPVRDNSRNPNRSRRGPVFDQDDEDAKETRRQMAARFKKEFIKQTADSDDAEFSKPRSDSESESVDSEKLQQASLKKPRWSLNNGERKRPVLHRVHLPLLPLQAENRRSRYE